MNFGSESAAAPIRGHSSSADVCAWKYSITADDTAKHSTHAAAAATLPRRRSLGEPDGIADDGPDGATFGNAVGEAGGAAEAMSAEAEEHDMR